MPDNIVNNLYYTAPTEEIFNEVKEKSISIWKTYVDDDCVSEKVDAIKDIPNIVDNFMYMVAMFDIHNQQRLADSIGFEARKAVKDRLIAGGTPGEFIVF